MGLKKHFLITWVSHRMKSYAIIDETRFPVIKIDFTGNKSTDENFQAYLEDTKACYRFEKRLVIVFDASNATIPSFSHQKMQADWLKENTALMQQFCAGTAYIIPNAAVRTILKLIFSLQKQPVPYQVFDSEQASEAWINSLI